MNVELSRLAAEDQLIGSRRSAALGQDSEKGAEHREAVLAMLKHGQVTISADYENAAIVFHAGQSLSDYKRTYSLATMALTLDPNRPTAQLLQRTSFDRLIASRGKIPWADVESVDSFSPDLLAPENIQTDASLLKATSICHAY